MLEFEVGVLFSDVAPGGVVIFGSFSGGAIVDWVDEAEEHFMLAVEQLTHTGRFSSHYKSISKRFHLKLPSCHIGDKHNSKLEFTLICRRLHSEQPALDFLCLRRSMVGVFVKPF